jgi:2'-5' RNA ligase
MRTFIAFDISDQTRSQIERAQKAIGRLRPVRWVNPGGIHLTMKFIRDISDALLPDVLRVMENAVEGIGPVSFEVCDLGWFGSGRRPRVIWANVKPEADLMEKIASRLNRGMAALGVEPERRAFRPHITLGRVRGAFDAEELEKAFERVESRGFGYNVADELVLYMSELGPGGARYTRMGAVSLPGNS